MQKALVKAMSLALLASSSIVCAIDVEVNGVTKSVTSYSVSQGASGVVVITTNPSVEFSSGSAGSVNPVARDDTANADSGVLKNISILSNDSASSLPLDTGSVVIVSGSSMGGTVTALNNGTVDYTSGGAFVGYDSFTYSVRDQGNNLSNVATVTVTVGNVADIPVAVADSSQTDQDVPVAINVVSNDTDTNNDLDPSSVQITVGPAHGTAVSNSSGVVTYTPASGYTGNDSFSYTVSDQAGHTSAPASVSLTVNSVSACGSVPTGVRLGSVIDWANPGSRATLDLRGAEIYSQKFVSTSNPAFGGQVVAAEASGYESIGRKVWISACPGGAPLASRCSSEGSSVRTVRWSQADSYFFCRLDRGTEYYINVQHQGCGANSTCRSYRSILNNGND